MKLLYCRSCRDCLRLQPTLRTCSCGRTRGQDHDGRPAEVYGRYAEVLGVQNISLMHALNSPDLEPTVFGIGPDVRAWAYPHNYEKVVRLP